MTILFFLKKEVDGASVFSDVRAAAAVARALPLAAELAAFAVESSNFEEPCRHLCEMFTALAGITEQVALDNTIDETLAAVGETYAVEDCCRPAVALFVATVWARRIGPALWTVGNISMLHSLLMWGSDCGPGSFRRTACAATGHRGREVQYLAPERIDTSLRKVLQVVESHVSSAAGHEIGAETFHVAAHALTKILAIHPFQDGNGRLARVLVNHIFWSFGVDACVPLVSGLRRKAGDHFVAVLERHQAGRMSVRDVAIYLAVMALEHITHRPVDAPD